MLYLLDRDQPPIDLGQVVALDWSGIDIRRESQGPERNPGTVQARAFAQLDTLRDWDVVVDDDGTGEVADLVAFKVDGNRLVVHFVHCKYSSKPEVGARLEDLYEVCGQAHRSAHHRQSLDAMVKNLIRRERNRRKGGPTGLLRGDDEALLALLDAVRLKRPELHITIVQPGLGSSQAQARHLQVLGATDVYVNEIAHGSFDVWCSA